MYIYVVLSQTGSFLGRIIRLVTHGEYSHASICLDRDFKELYSFGRLHSYNPVFGGYVKESPDYGTFKRFRKTRVSILRLEVEADRYERIRAYLEHMYEDRERYKYNYTGLFWAAFNRAVRHKDRYYCSEFVGEVLKQFGVIEACALGPVIKPMDFLKLPGSDVVYRGRLSVFSKKTEA